MKPINVKYSCKCAGCQCLLPVGSGAYYSPGRVLCGRCYRDSIPASETREIRRGTSEQRAFNRHLSRWVRGMNYTTTKKGV